MRTAIALCLMIAPMTAPAATTSEPPVPGKSYSCNFGPHGKMTIDTRNPGATITIDGKTRPAMHGSYFYQTQDGEIAVMFGPDMRFWDYRGIRDDHCAVRDNG